MRLHLVPGKYYALTDDVDPRHENAIKYGPYDTPEEAFLVAQRASRGLFPMERAAGRPFWVARLSSTNAGELIRQ